VFFHKHPSRIEVLNDLDEEVVNFFRVCQHHATELQRWLRWAVASRRLFEIFSMQKPETLTDIQRAARFLYLQKNSFGAEQQHQPNKEETNERAASAGPENVGSGHEDADTETLEEEDAS